MGVFFLKTFQYAFILFCDRSGMIHEVVRR